MFVNSGYSNYYSFYAGLTVKRSNKRILSDLLMQKIRAIMWMNSYRIQLRYSFLLTWLLALTNSVR